MKFARLSVVMLILCFLCTSLSSCCCTGFGSLLGKTESPATQPQGESVATTAPPVAETTTSTTPTTTTTTIPVATLPQTPVPTDCNTDPNTTEVVNGITVTALPYNASGLIVSSVSISGSYADLVLTNNTGYAIDDYSSIAYTCYDATGNVVKTGYVYFKDVNNGESSTTYFSIDGTIAKIIFGEATISRGDTFAEGPLTMQDGMIISAMPYEVNGMAISSLTFSGSYVNLVLTNNTGYAIDDYSYILYKCYDSNGNVQKNGAVYFKDVNAGESSTTYFSIENNTAKIVFGEGEVFKGETFVESATSTYEGMVINTLPYDTNGMTVSSVSISGTYANLVLTNNTGHAISDDSYIPYKCYDNNGYVQKTGVVYFKDVNAGESSTTYFNIENNTAKIVFGEGVEYKGETFTEGATTTHEGMVISALPYESNGLAVTAISFSGTNAELIIVNNTGYAISDSSNIVYKCYDSDGNVQKNGKLYFDNMSNGESSTASISIESNTAKIVFGEGTPYRQ